MHLGLCVGVGDHNISWERIPKIKRYHRTPILLDCITLYFLLFLLQKTDAAIDISIVKQINCISSSTEDERNCEDHFENYECTTNQNGICEGEILTEDFSYIIIEVRI